MTVSGVISRERSSIITYVIPLHPSLVSCSSFCVLTVIGAISIKNMAHKLCLIILALWSMNAGVHTCSNINHSMVLHIMLQIMSPQLMHGYIPYGIDGLPLEAVLTYSRSFTTEICCIASQSCMAMAVTTAMHDLSMVGAPSSHHGP